MSFLTPLRRWRSPHGWFYVAVPPEHALPVTHPWGRTPVVATVNGHAWDTSTWRDKAHGAVLMVPADVRGGLEEGATVEVHLAPRALFPGEQGSSTRKRRSPRRS